jgi:hypothetical protein
MRIGPGADANRINIICRDDLPPIALDTPHPKLVRNALGRLDRTIRHGREFDALDRGESGQMPQTGISARSDQTYPQSNHGQTQLTTG